jgi:ribulose-phosphate 3-epimerase
MNTLIAPSILSADFGRLAQEIQAVEKAGADWIHFDVMDGCFVPNITIGPLVAVAARKATKLPLDVHLMVDAPDKFLKIFADAGADYLVVHAEACTHLHRTLQMINDLGVKAGVAFNPATPIDTLPNVIDLVDLVLIMTVNPGFGGQKFIESMLGKIVETKALIESTGREIHLQVDGGVSGETSAKVIEAGANVLVAGSAIYGKSDYAAAIKSIRKE